MAFQTWSPFSWQSSISKYLPLAQQELASLLSHCIDQCSCCTLQYVVCNIAQMSLRPESSWYYCNDGSERPIVFLHREACQLACCIWTSSPSQHRYMSVRASCWTKMLPFLPMWTAFPSFTLPFTSNVDYQQSVFACFSHPKIFSHNVGFNEKFCSDLSPFFTAGTFGHFQCTPFCNPISGCRWTRTTLFCFVFCFRGQHWRWQPTVVKMWLTSRPWLKLSLCSVPDCRIRLCIRWCS